MELLKFLRKIINIFVIRSGIFLLSFSLLACGKSIPDETAGMIEELHLSKVSTSDLLNQKIQDSLLRLKNESCNRDAMSTLGGELIRAGYHREAANVLIHFSDACGNVDGFLSAALDNLLALSDYKEAMKVANRLIESHSTSPQLYFSRGQIFESTKQYSQALSDYMETFALTQNIAIMSRGVFFRTADMNAKLGRYCEAMDTIRMWMSGPPDRQDDVQAKEILTQYSAKKNCPSTYASGKDTFTRQSGKTILVHAMINGIDGTFVVDTGASDVALTPAFAKRAHISLEKAKKIKFQTANGINEGLQTKASSIRVGKVQASDVTVSVTAGESPSFGRGIDGLLGQSFLSRFEVSFTSNHWSITQRN